MKKTRAVTLLLCFAALLTIMSTDAAASAASSFEQENGKNVVQTYQGKDWAEVRQNDDGSWTEYGEPRRSTHTIYWAQGITPPKVPTDPSHTGDGYFEEFHDKTIVGYRNICYREPVRADRGYYDLNKVDMDMRCYLSSAANLIYWWLDQNDAYVTEYLNNVDSYQQLEGRVDLTAVDWNHILKRPVPETYNGLTTTRLDSSNLVTGPLNAYSIYSGTADSKGYSAHYVLNSFFNGTQDGVQKPENSGYFYPAMAVEQEPVSRRVDMAKYEAYNRELKRLLMSGHGISISFRVIGTNHAVTLWGAEYKQLPDGTEELVRVYVTDSDDFEEVMGGTRTLRGLHSYNVYADKGGSIHFSQSTQPHLNLGSYGAAITVLELRQKQWETFLYGTGREPSPAVILVQPQDAVYSGNMQNPRPLTVRAELAEADQGTSAALTYQWYRSKDGTTENRVRLNGQTGTAYTPVIGSTPGKEYYFCEITTHKYGRTVTAVTDVAVITTTDKALQNAAEPVFVQDLVRPGLAAYPAGGVTPILRVEAVASDGGEISYQWFRRDFHGNVERIPGAAGPALVMPNEEGDFDFYCVATNTNTGAQITGNTTASKTSGTYSVSLMGDSGMTIMTTDVPQNPKAGDSFRLQTNQTNTAHLNWEITRGGEFASIDASGYVTVTGNGCFTVSAENRYHTAQITFNPQLLASWKVTFVTPGASAVPQQMVPQGSQLEKPADPVRTGYVFTGWFRDAALKQAVSLPFTPQQDTVLYAGWALQGTDRGPEYQITGMTVSSGSLASGDFTLDVALVNLAAAQTDRLLIAAYDRDGKLMAMTAQQIVETAARLPGAGQPIPPVRVSLHSVKGVSQVRAFILPMTGPAVPLSALFVYR